MEKRNVLVTCGGKWVGMILQLKSSMRLVPELASGSVYVADTKPITPAGAFADSAFQVPRIDEDSYVDKLLELCESGNVRVLVPLIDVDVLRLAPHARRFQSIGTHLVAPAQKLVQLCFDKSRFDHFAGQRDIRVPASFRGQGLLTAPYPLFYKRRHGFGSIGSGIARSCEEALHAVRYDPDLIFQECFESKEISVDGFVSRTGAVLYGVQRVRDKVLGGEVFHSHTVKLESIKEAAHHVLRALSEEGFQGPANVQFFLQEPPVLFDANPRLGSGSVLSNAATNGKLFAAVLLEACGGTAPDCSNTYEESLYLDRFFGDVFYSASSHTITRPLLTDAAVAAA